MDDGTFRRVLLTMVALVAAGGWAQATMLTIQPSNQDAYVIRSRPNSVHGSAVTATRMFVQPDNPLIRYERSLVQFDLPIPQFSTITSATLQINQQSGVIPAARIHGAHRITSAWLQNSVKWNTMPTFDPTATSTASVGLSRGFKDFPVTADVQAMVNDPSANHGWMIIDTRETLDNANNREVGYVTREEFHGPDIPKRPILLVDFTAPSCTLNSQCADTNACTVNERCEGGVCVVDPLGCDDGDLCTDDICDVEDGCQHVSGICSDGFSCTQDICDPGTGECSYVFDDTVCLHGGCQTGTCEADQNDETLDPITGCAVTSIAPDGSSCSDGNGCTQSDTCDGGECEGGPPVSCSGDQCRNPGTCDPGTGQCNGSPKPSGTPCSDGNACTQTDECDGSGDCDGSNPVVCTPLDQCHLTGTCDPGSGVCSNPNAPDGTGCTDGSACTQTDTCQGGACDGANPVVCTPLDQCHIAGTCDSGTGLCSNPTAPNGTPCSDGNVCTLNDQCTAGACGGDPASCGDSVVQPSCGEQCDGGPDCSPTCQFLCGPTPRTDCVTAAAPQKARLTLRNRTPDKRDLLVWKFSKGNAVTSGQLGTPLTTTGHRICVWDASANPQPLFSANVLGGGTCGVKPCWKAIKDGFKFKDRDALQHGTSNILVKAGAASKSKAMWKGKGVLLLPPTLPLTPTVTVQLENDEGTCWTTTFATPLLNVADQFKAKGD